MERSWKTHCEGTNAMITIILNDAPYGNERAYNGLRLALSLVKNNTSVCLFLQADAVFCALKNQKTPNGYYNIGRMIQSLLRRGVPVHTCGTCCASRGVQETQLIDGVHLSNLETLTSWVKKSQQTIVF